jgi:hypothetical protein
MGHAANIGGIAAAEDQAAPVRKASPRRKVSATGSGGAEARPKRASQPTGTAKPKTPARKAADGQTAAAKPKTTARAKAADAAASAAKPKTTPRPRTSGVRRGSGSAAKPTTTRPAARKAAPGAGSSRRAQPAPRTGSTLDQDLAKHAAETYTEADLEAGKKLAVSILSKVATSGGLAAMLSVLMPGAQASAGAGGLTSLLSKLSETYGDLSAQDQKHLRAVVAWVKSGFHLKLES